MELPPAVQSALRAGQKIEAIKRLREEWAIDLSEAKRLVEQWEGEPASPANTPPATHAPSPRLPLPALLLLLAFAWALVNAVTPLASLLVLFHLEHYRTAPFIVESLEYRDDPEEGLRWGLVGQVAGRHERLYAPSLADGHRLGYRGLQRQFPAGLELRVWYNPEVTDTLFQGRSLRLLPYSPNLRESELAHLYEWFGYCLLPLALIWGNAVVWERRQKEAVTRR